MKRNSAAAAMTLHGARRAEGGSLRSRSGGADGYLVLGRDGAIVDSVFPPANTIEPHVLTLSRGELVVSQYVPFTPTHVWTWSPSGHLASARGDRYSITLFGIDGTLRRIERDAEPIAVAAEEREDMATYVTATLRRFDPAWRWEGPAVPDVKPLIRDIDAGDDGSLWVTVSQPGVRLPRDTTRELWRASPWTEPAVHDVFAVDGTLRARVAAPERTVIHAMRGDQAWGVVRDSLDVQRVVRCRLESARGARGAGG